MTAARSGEARGGSSAGERRQVAAENGLSREEAATPRPTRSMFGKRAEDDAEACAGLRSAPTMGLEAPKTMTRSSPRGRDLLWLATYKHFDATGGLIDRALGDSRTPDLVPSQIAVRAESITGGRRSREALVGGLWRRLLTGPPP